MSTCNVDVRWFPFDIQRCELKFGSWTYDGWLLDLQMNDADVSGYMANGEWDLIGEDAFVLREKLPEQSSPFLCVSAPQGFPGPGARSFTTAVRSRTRPSPSWWRSAGGRSTTPSIFSSPACCCPP